MSLFSIIVMLTIALISGVGVYEGTKVEELGIAAFFALAVVVLATQHIVNALKGK